MENFIFCAVCSFILFYYYILTVISLSTILDFYDEMFCKLVDRQKFGKLYFQTGSLLEVFTVRNL